jgi:hypothetical protein
MNYTLGIFLNNTNSDLKYNTNLYNYKNLEKNFNYIVIIDLNNENSFKLRNEIIDYTENKIINYFMNNDYLKSSNNYIIDCILFILENINYSNFKYITFIDDNYIYCNDLNNYFNYFKLHDLDLCSYSDSTEILYHFQLYLFTINIRSIGILLQFLKKNNISDIYNFYKLFNKKMPFLKVAYLNENLYKNIFFNNNYIYEYYLVNNLLPIISIDHLLFLKDNFDIEIYIKIPSKFNFNIYKSTMNLDYNQEIYIQEHFLKDGQFKLVKYTDKNYNNTILPEFIREKLQECKLLDIFDIPIDFNIFIYRNHNKDLESLDEKNLIKHWINYGKYENRLYK